ncbi:hypothetical protein B0H15DRAFT_836978 [Mycena belliarum]|uniref:Uncharacterized protein n=1 Tax=Mycena belliarum TaxID=1033014 RepID=A0AAD6XQ09_9AGAR|nr:hypothetical protein B0H15DRAFT_836978 [Mycena belliae]
MPTHGSSITACNNLVRCGLGAALVSAIQPLLGAGYAYLLLGGICALMVPVVYLRLDIRIGPRCRARRIRMAEQQTEKDRARGKAEVEVAAAA